MYFPRVGRVAAYSGQYHHHWEAGVGITVRVFPLPHLLLGVALLTVLVAAVRLGLVSWEFTALAASVIVLWVCDAAHERWSPSELPDESACVAAYGALRRAVRFEAVVGPKHSWFNHFRNRWDREVRIVRYLECGLTHHYPCDPKPG
jgi:hypothetical protein